MIQTLKSDLNEMGSKHLAILIKQEEEITRTISVIAKSIADRKKLLDSNDAPLVSAAYKSRIDEFRKLPYILTVSNSLPSSDLQMISKEQLYQQFDSLSELSIKTEEHGLGDESSPEKPLIDAQWIIAVINTEYGKRKLRSVSDGGLRTCAEDKMLRLYNVN